MKNSNLDIKIDKDLIIVQGLNFTLKDKLKLLFFTEKTEIRLTYKNIIINGKKFSNK